MVFWIPPQDFHNILFPYAPNSFSARNAERIKFIHIIFMKLLKAVSSVFYKFTNLYRMTPCFFNLLWVQLFKT